MQRQVLAFALLTFTAGFAFADELLINQVDRAVAERPDRGTAMDGVRSRHGEPAEIKAAVGAPPITRWVYDEFTVYFERDRVIHAVARR